MKFSDFLTSSKIAIYLSFVCTVFTLVYVILSLYGIRIRGKGLFVLPIVEGIGCILFIVALIIELVRYHKN